MPLLANPRHEVLAQELAKGKSVREAYYLAGYIGTSNVSRLKNHPKIMARVEELLAQGARRTEVTAARTITELGRIAFADIRGLFNTNGALKPVNLWPDDLARAVATLDTDELFDGSGKRRERIGVTRKVKLADKLRALEMLGRSFGLFKDKLEVATSVEQMSDEELSALVAELREHRAALEEGAGESGDGAGEAGGAQPAGELSPLPQAGDVSRRGGDSS
jgi:phage terminase small subunit